MGNNIFYFLFGFMLMGLIAMVIVAYNPTPETHIVCGGCGGEQWYSILAGGE